MHIFIYSQEGKSFEQIISFKWIFVILSTSRIFFSIWVIIIIYFTLVENNYLIYYSIMKSRKLNAYLNRGTFIDILIWLLNNARKKYKKTKLQESIILSIELFRFAVNRHFVYNFRLFYNVYDNSFYIRLNYCRLNFLLLEFLLIKKLEI